MKIPLREGSLRRERRPVVVATVGRRWDGGCGGDAGDGRASVTECMLWGQGSKRYKTWNVRARLCNTIFIHVPRTQRRGTAHQLTTPAPHRPPRRPLRPDPGPALVEPGPESTNKRVAGGNYDQGSRKLTAIFSFRSRSDLSFSQPRRKGRQAHAAPQQRTARGLCVCVVTRGEASRVTGGCDGTD
jgi:hypothetical protein